LLVIELWGLGDLALAIPFLRAASEKSRVTLVAKPHAQAILSRFAPKVDLVPFTAPWTAFLGKYRLYQWPWHELTGLLNSLRYRHFDAGVSARVDPRDHAFLWLAGANRRFGFPVFGSSVFLNSPLAAPVGPHRADHWESIALALGLDVTRGPSVPRTGRRILIHAGAARPERIWPRNRFELLASQLESAGWATEIIDDRLVGVDLLLSKLDSADRFIGNDSGPGHLASLLGVPTFTIFGPQLPSLFAPRHEKSRWIEGSDCRYKPCKDHCRYSEPRCILSTEVPEVLKRVYDWLES